MAPQLMDTFATFVDTLAERLDDHDTSGDDLAARAYLSRFHFDRVVGAATGEPPTRPRRCVLLERADFRLVTSRATVLDVAIEAGYSSYEAFTKRSSGLRDRAVRVAHITPADPDRKPERCAFPSTGRSQAACKRRGDLDGTHDEDGRAARVARR